MAKKYLDLTGLQSYDELIKSLIDDKIENGGNGGECKGKVDREYSTDYEYTDGLVFTFVTDHYVVGDNSETNGNGYTGTATDVIIPKYYDDGVNGVAKVREIGQRAFTNCTSLVSITLPSGLISIGDYVFSNCSSLTSVTLPSSVTSISNNAFRYCFSLTSITLPSGFTSIGEAAFTNCTSLVSITLPSGLISISNNAFRYCSSLTSITLPSSVTSIGDYAFRFCSSLASITLNSTTPPTLGIQPFVLSGITATTGAIYVPHESLEAYKTATNWVTYANVIYPIPDGKWVTDAIGDIETLLGGI